MKNARFGEMSVAEQYRFVSEFVMRQCLGNIREAAVFRGVEKCAYYFSAEYLMGRMIYSNLLNLGILTQVKEAMAENGADLAAVAEVPDLALGTGGLDIFKYLDLAKQRDISVVVETKTIAGLKESARWLHANK